MLIRPRPIAIVLLLCLFAYAIALPFFGGPFALKLVTRIMITGMFVISLDLLIGFTGLVSFGHALYFGLGAYSLYFISSSSAAANAFFAIPFAIALAASVALIIGSVVVLTRAFYFIMVTLAFGQMGFSLFFDTKIAGGTDGAYINVRPMFSLGSYSLLDFSNRVSFFYFCLAALVLSYVFLLWLVRTPFGRVLQGISHNESRMSALGYNTYAYKLASYVIAAALAGFAGMLFAAIDGYVAPELLGWRESGLAIMMVVLGGAGTLYGPLLGAIVYSIVEETLKSSTELSTFFSLFTGQATAKWLGGLVANSWSMALGFFLIAAVLAAPKGIAGFIDKIAGEAKRPSPRKFFPSNEKREPAVAMQLDVENLSRSFGGLVAVNAVSVKFAHNKVHGIIGPNGAGKTTFINVLSGALRPSSGNIRLESEEIGGRKPYAIARLGLGRSYQRTNVILAFTARENCALAAQARFPSPLRLSNKFRREEEYEAVESALKAAGIASDRADIRASNLSHGEQRQLEIAMLIASGAKLLLLDEPLAGMGPEETSRVTALLRELSSDHTIVLIEHDMDAIFAAADTLTVLVEGRLLAHGTPEEIRSNASVREAYLGEWGQETKP